MRCNYNVFHRIHCECLLINRIHPELQRIECPSTRPRLVVRFGFRGAAGINGSVLVGVVFDTSDLGYLLQQRLFSYIDSEAESNVNTLVLELCFHVLVRLQCFLYDPSHCIVMEEGEEVPDHEGCRR